MKTFSQLKSQLLKDPEIAREYELLEPRYKFASEVIAQRLKKGLTQLELAEKVGTSQSAIARLESGNYNASLLFIEKVAKALDVQVTLKLG